MKSNKIHFVLSLGAVLSTLFLSSLFSQIQVVNLPEEGFEERINSAIDEIWIIDTHEHLVIEEEMLEGRKEEPLDFTHLFKHYLQDDPIISYLCIQLPKWKRWVRSTGLL
jgi:hypothetical protein